MRRRFAVALAAVGLAVTMSLPAGAFYTPSGWGGFTTCYNPGGVTTEFGGVEWSTIRLRTSQFVADNPNVPERIAVKHRVWIYDARSQRWLIGAEIGWWHQEIGFVNVGTGVNSTYEPKNYGLDPLIYVPAGYYAVQEIVYKRDPSTGRWPDSPAVNQLLWPGVVRCLRLDGEVSFGSADAAALTASLQQQVNDAETRTQGKPAANDQNSEGDSVELIQYRQPRGR